jgi:two-component system response regulator DevR
MIIDPAGVAGGGLRSLLEAETHVEVVTEIPADADAMSPFTSGPAVVIAYPGDSVQGIELCRETHSKFPELICVVVSGHGDDDGVFRAVLAGAAGYLLARDDPAASMEVVRSALAGKRPLDVQLVSFLQQQTAAGLRSEGPLADLTEQQRRIVDLVVEGLTNREIGRRLSLSEYTVRNYLSRIFAKLDVRNRTELASRLSANALQQRGPTF